MPTKKYAIVYHEISNNPMKFEYFMGDLEQAKRFADKKADQGYLPVYIIETETEEVVYDV